MQEQNLKIVVYTSESKGSGGISSIKKMFSDLSASNQLAYRLAKRDISALYRQSLLGYLWAFLIPVLNTLTWLFLQKSGVVAIKGIDIPYPVYIFSGTILWQIFVESLQAPVQQVVASKSMLSKLNFPREAIVVSGIYKNLFNAGIKLLVLIPLLLYFGTSPGWTIVFAPFVILSIIMIGTSVGLFLAPVGTLYSDIGRVLPFIGQFLMFFAPVVFAMPAEGFSRTLFTLNFMTPVIITARDIFTNGAFEWLNYFIWVNIGAFLLLFIGWAIYRITMPILIERMSS